MTVERRGRGSTGRPKKLPKDVEKDLLAEVQRLRAENDYLKNLQTSMDKGYKQDKIEMRGIERKCQISTLSEHGR